MSLTIVFSSLSVAAYAFQKVIVIGEEDEAVVAPARLLDVREERGAKGALLLQPRLQCRAITTGQQVDDPATPERLCSTGIVTCSSTTSGEAPG